MHHNHTLQVVSLLLEESAREEMQSNQKFKWHKAKN